ncbi:uncharacterized protein LOC107620083 [Arachis ipaensis]|uniref:uncharacterized protein LOC107620083 n=1 Tax=Arachis ipaensis TaxID=130454 RepID=UPI0007AF6821|nr:uncharacterized protein LOC107620083 [Arachis ipaensis]XP_025684649.1 uncharacterized protein LOC112785391 [Arachis hypogaea]
MEFTAAVMGFFESARLPAEANVTWVALAMKFVGAKEIKELRPISMVGCVYKLKKKKSAIIKLDFQKAYDRVKWCFVDTVLEKMSFGRKWRAWVRECVTLASISILVNGSPSKPSKMERGLRQGDPLSPFLFVLVVDVLNRMIGEAVAHVTHEVFWGKDDGRLGMALVRWELVQAPKKIGGLGLEPKSLAVNSDVTEEGGTVKGHMSCANKGSTCQAEDD